MHVSAHLRTCMCASGCRCGVGGNLFFLFGSGGRVFNWYCSSLFPKQDVVTYFFIHLFKFRVTKENVSPNCLLSMIYVHLHWHIAHFGKHSRVNRSLAELPLIIIFECRLVLLVLLSDLVQFLFKEYRLLFFS